jgi:prepilin-type N-terminal cleavage/methylation domain-containing protein
MKKKEKTQGFTMVEIIVALVLLSTSFLAIFGALQVCSRASYHTRMLTEATLLSEKLFTEKRLKNQISFDTTKGSEGPFKWQVKVAPTEAENVGAIRVQVEWKEQNRPQKWELFSIIYMPPLAEGK